MKFIGMFKFNMGFLVQRLLTIQNALDILASNVWDWEEQEQGKVCRNWNVGMGIMI